MSEKQYLVVTSRALAGRDEEYLSWYLDRHIPDVTAVPGYVSGSIHRSVGPDGVPTGEFKALYEVEALAPTELMATLMSRVGEMDVSGAIDPGSVNFTFLIPA